jgi:hypothetical protein
VAPLMGGAVAGIFYRAVATEPANSASGRGK